MSDEESDELKGAAIFPSIPAQVQVHPLLLAVLHATVFLTSDKEIVHPAAADQAWQQIADYLGRLEGADLRRVKEDILTLRGYARQQDWPREDLRFLKSFLAEMGVEGEGEE
jgi:hypothetical protein